MGEDTGSSILLELILMDLVENKEPDIEELVSKYEKRLQEKRAEESLNNLWRGL